MVGETCRKSSIVEGVVKNIPIRRLRGSGPAWYAYDMLTASSQQSRTTGSAAGGPDRHVQIIKINHTPSASRWA